VASEFKLPELGENVHGGDVLRVLVKPGDAVKTDQPVLELETDKATIEVPSSVDGTVGEVKVKPGEKVKVGQTIFTVDAAAAKDGKAPTKEQTQPIDAAAEGGQSQRVEGDRATPAASKEEAAAERESDKPGTAAPPEAQRTPMARQP
jgi:pyruvate dehydrogenase E2 component (dihydrolipoamide acetyltransferase)